MKNISNINRYFRHLHSFTLGSPHSFGAAINYFCYSKSICFSLSINTTLRFPLLLLCCSIKHRAKAVVRPTSDSRHTTKLVFLAGKNKSVRTGEKTGKIPQKRILMLQERRISGHQPKGWLYPTFGLQILKSPIIWNVIYSPGCWFFINFNKCRITC